MSDIHSNHPVVNLITEITHALSARQGPRILDQTLSCLADVDLNTESMLQLDPSIPYGFADALDVAIAHIPPQ